MTTSELAFKYAGATGKLLGIMNFVINYDSLTAEEMREELKKTMEAVEKELGKIEE